jgi:hypothetical protein
MVDIMDAPPVIGKRRIPRSGLLLILASCAIGTLALGYIGYILQRFYVGTASLPPGTEIRPMGVAFHLGLTWTASILFGSACALIGGILSVRQRRWILVAFAVLAGCLSWLPLFVSDWGFDRIVTLRQLVLSP